MIKQLPFFILSLLVYATIKQYLLPNTDSWINLLIMIFRSSFFLWLLSLPLLLLAAPIEDPPITHHVWFQIKHGDKDLGKITMGLFGTVVPRSVENFVQLTKGYEGTSYTNSIFHRIIKGFMVQGGDFEFGSGIGGWSIYGKKFEDENFKIRFTKPGYLAYANSGPDSNGSQFFITTAVTSWLDGRHVIFGKVIDGFETLSSVENVKTGKNDKPEVDVVIAAAGVDQVDVSDSEKIDWDESTKPVDSSHKGWILFVLAIFVAITAYGVRLRHLQHKEIREEIEFHRI